eukprot:RCo010088
MALLVTGSPGVGKTTLLLKVGEYLCTAHPAVAMDGFITTELRGSGGRVGFNVVTLDKRVTAPLARIGEHQGPRVGRYVVDLSSFENVAIPVLERIRAGLAKLLPQPCTSLTRLGKWSCSPLAS